ncbi:MAG: hypothetical protein AVDCRST_MAG23-1982, partial [uncultured Sphingosinicella sp.]
WPRGSSRARVGSWRRASSTFTAMATRSRNHLRHIWR